MIFLAGGGPTKKHPSRKKESDVSPPPSFGHRSHRNRERYNELDMTSFLEVEGAKGSIKEELRRKYGKK